MECRDAAIFMSIPALLIMKALLETAEGSDIWRNLCTRFKEDITEGEDWQQTERQLRSFKGEKSKTLLDKLRMQVLELTAANQHTSQHQEQYLVNTCVLNHKSS